MNLYSFQLHHEKFIIIGIHSWYVGVVFNITRLIQLHRERDFLWEELNLCFFILKILGMLVEFLILLGGFKFDNHEEIGHVAVKVE